MSKTFKITLATAAAMASLITAAPMAASAQSNGITSCDAPGGRQQAGAVIGGVIGALAGSRISSNERALGAVAGGAAGAAAGSYIGCNQQRARATQVSTGGQYRALSKLNVRSGPGTNYRVVVRTTDGETVAKEILALTARTVTLGSINPAYEPRTVPRRQIAWMARILWVSQ